MELTPTPNTLKWIKLSAQVRYYSWRWAEARARAEARASGETGLS